MWAPQDHPSVWGGQFLTVGGGGGDRDVCLVADGKVIVEAVDFINDILAVRLVIVMTEGIIQMSGVSVCRERSKVLALEEL